TSRAPISDSASFNGTAPPSAGCGLDSQRRADSVSPSKSSSARPKRRPARSQPVRLVRPQLALLAPPRQRAAGDLHEIRRLGLRQPDVLLKALESPKRQALLDRLQQLGGIELADPEERRVGVRPGTPGMRIAHEAQHVRRLLLALLARRAVAHRGHLLWQIVSAIWQDGETGPGSFEIVRSAD